MSDKDRSVMPNKREVWNSFSTRIAPLLDVHNRIRTKLFQEPGPEGHLINENLVVRMAAVAEVLRLKPRSDRLPRDWGHGDIGVRVLFFFRDLILHRDGRLDTRASRGVYKQAYDRFCDRCPDARVKEGEQLRLPGQPVLTELLADVTSYILTRCPGQLGRPESRTTGQQGDDG